MENTISLQNRFKTLAERLESPNSSVRIDAFNQLENLKDADAVEPLIKLLENRTPVIRARLCTTLGNIGDDRALSFLFKCLRDPNKNVRLMACIALDKIGDPSAIAHLFGRLKDENSEIRNAALTALQNIGDGRLGRAILNDDSQDLIRILQKDDPRAVDPLMEGLVKQSRNDRAAIKKALIASYEQFKPSYQHFLCLEHLTRFTKYNNKHIPIGLFKRLPYYGCRICGKSINALTDVQEVVAIIDMNMHTTAILDNGVFEVNYIRQGALFDFDRVEIINADDNIIDIFIKKLSRNSKNLLNKKCGEIDCRVSGKSGVTPSRIDLLTNIFHKVEHV